MTSLEVSFFFRRYLISTKRACMINSQNWTLWPLSSFSNCWLIFYSWLQFEHFTIFEKKNIRKIMCTRYLPCYSFPLGTISIRNLTYAKVLYGLHLETFCMCPVATNLISILLIIPWRRPSWSAENKYRNFTGKN